ncbi:hypothetical protein HanXRQr2_Chr15g0674851 [Helianthus annuus]|uniref:Uncharacterized protein n=1 Tax=Helianthus annuus TaxID=4232 RepID=A0A9K3DWQ7_HELAN|nr:hypothetical protein HanXRQr2_Chr15g0674851 [Helianthus annuus]
MFITDIAIMIFLFKNKSNSFRIKFLQSVIVFFQNLSGFFWVFAELKWNLKESKFSELCLFCSKIFMGFSGFLLNRNGLPTKLQNSLLVSRIEAANRFLCKKKPLKNLGEPRNDEPGRVGFGVVVDEQDGAW